MSDDGNYKLTIGGQYQMRYDFLDLDNGTNGGVAQDYSKFQLRRAKVMLSGNAFTKDLTYKMNINFANSNGGSTSNGGLLEETYLQYRLIDEVQFRFGQDKVQFGRGFITSSGALQFVDASNICNSFVPGYDIGLSLGGIVLDGLINYTVGVYGGTGQDTFRATNDNAFAARIVVNPLGPMKYSESDVENSNKPLLSIAGSYYKNALKKTAGAGSLETNNTSFGKSYSSSTSTPGGWFVAGQNATGAIPFTTNEHVYFDLFGADAAFKWKGFSFQGEYFLAQANGEVSHLEQIGQGFYVQSGYFVIPKTLELAARYAYMDPNRNQSNNHWVETTGAISWYINEHNLKLQTDFTNIHRQGRLASSNASATAKSTDDQLFRVQAQLLF
jgi:phosphate-selective porin OprO/OprP